MRVSRQLDWLRDLTAFGSSALRPTEVLVWPGKMPRGTGFENVEEIARTLPGVEVSTAWGQPALKVRGKMFACLASHTSAEPNTLVVRMDFAQRDALIQEEPGTYYLKEHYMGYPCVLVRVSSVLPDALRELIIGAHRYMSADPSRRPARPGPGTRKPRPR